MLFRTRLRSIHKWLGLSITLLLLCQAITGIVLVYRDPIQRLLLDEEIYIARPVTSPNIDGMLHAATTWHPDYRVVRMDYPDDRQQAMIIRLQQYGGKQKAYLLGNPLTGEIISEISGWAVAPFWVFELHKEFLSGDFGSYLIALEGIALVFLFIGGIYLWWPSRKRLLPSFMVSGNSNKKISIAIRRLELHRFCGLIGAPLLLVVAITGTVIAIKILLSDSSTVLAAGLQQPIAVNPIIEHLTESTGQAVKDVRFTMDRSRMSVNLYSVDTVRPLAVDRIIVNLENGRIESRRRSSEAAGFAAFYSWMYPIHSGKFFGWIGRTLLTVAGVLLLLQVVLGCLLFAERRRVRRVQSQKIVKVITHEIS